MSAEVYPVVKKDRVGRIMTIYAVCDTYEEALATAENANKWYGRMHPLTPLEVGRGVLFNPIAFPEA